jgi:hypothetical protein
MVPEIFMTVLLSFRLVLLLHLYVSFIKAEIQNNLSTFYLFHIVICMLKVGIAEAERTPVAREMLCKHVSMATQSCDFHSGRPVWFCYSGFQQTRHNILISFTHFSRIAFQSPSFFCPIIIPFPLLPSLPPLHIKTVPTPGSFLHLTFHFLPSILP